MIRASARGWGEGGRLKQACLCFNVGPTVSTACDEGMVRIPVPTSCTASLEMVMTINGVSAANFTSTSAAAARGAIADLLQPVAGSGAGLKVSTLLILSTGSIAVARRTAGDSEDKMRQAGTSGILPSLVLRVRVLGIDPPTGLALLAQARLAPGRISDAVGAKSAAFYGGDVVINDPGLALVAGPDQWGCSEGYTLNSFTGRCCATVSNSSTIISPPQDLSRVVWSPDGCKWWCRTSLLVGADCLTCSEALRGQALPPNAFWDDSSPTCEWKCNAGYIIVGQTCQLADTVTISCAKHSRCALCTLDPACVWCQTSTGINSAPGSLPGSCVPSAGSRAGTGCPYGGGACTCSSSSCPGECILYVSCDPCEHDPYCGWCGSSQTCAKGNYLGPDSPGNCTTDWETAGHSKCNADISIAGVIAACAAVSAVVVASMVAYFIIKTRMHSRKQTTAPDKSVQPYMGGSKPKEMAARILRTFPLFKFSPDEHLATNPNVAVVERKIRPSIFDGIDKVAEPGDDEVVCAVCLTNFVAREELRLLPCQHTFHRACIEEWLAHSQHCPLCKRAVLSRAGCRAIAAAIAATGPTMSRGGVAGPEGMRGLRSSAEASWDVPHANGDGSGEKPSAF